jgi:hypothetical protein
MNKTGSQESFGRIHRIFTVSDGDPIFYIDVISSMFNFECLTATDIYSYTYNHTGSFGGEKNCVFIGASDIVEKCIFSLNEPIMFAPFIDFQIWKIVPEITVKKRFLHFVSDDFCYTLSL